MVQDIVREVLWMKQQQVQSAAEKSAGGVVEGGGISLTR